jgi:putative FmdB family regulatory protein
MPIYEYMCKKCNKISEKWCYSNRIDELIVCEHCGETAHRIVSQTSFILKGGGWYADGYNKKEKK